MLFDGGGYRDGNRYSNSHYFIFDIRMSTSTITWVVNHKKSIIPLYVGCAVSYYNSYRKADDVGLLEGILINHKKPVKVRWVHTESQNLTYLYPCSYEEVKLILRPLSDMTGDECIKVASILGVSSHLSNESKIFQVKELMADIFHKQTNIPGYRWMQLTKYLLSKGFDLFDLIGAGLAIDKTKMQGV
jgi:hypothetical protein